MYASYIVCCVRLFLFIATMIQDWTIHNIYDVAWTHLHLCASIISSFSAPFLVCRPSIHQSLVHWTIQVERRRWIRLVDVSIDGGIISKKARQHMNRAKIQKRHRMLGGARTLSVGFLFVLYEFSSSNFAFASEWSVVCVCVCVCVWWLQQWHQHSWHSALMNWQALTHTHWTHIREEASP